MENVVSLDGEDQSKDQRSCPDYWYIHVSRTCFQESFEGGCLESNK